MNGLPIVRAPAWDEFPSTWRVMTRATVAAVSAMLLVIAVSFAARRLSLAASNSTAPGSWLALGTLGLVVLAAVQRLLWADARPVRDAGRWAPADVALCVASSAYVIVGGLTLGSLAPGLAWQLVIVVLIVAEECWALGGLRTVRLALRSRGRWPRSRSVDAAAHSPTREAVAPVLISSPAPAIHSSVATGTRSAAFDASDASEEDELLDEEDAPWLPQGVTQQLTRGVEASRGEYVVGVLTVDFAPGQRTETLHVAFCPPLARAPKIQLQPVDGPPLTATVGQAESFGARFELRLARAWEEPQRVVLQFETIAGASG